MVDQVRLLGALILTKGGHASTVGCGFSAIDSEGLQLTVTRM